MPQMNSKTAKKVGAQEAKEFEALPPGTYIATLLKCSTADGQAGPYWKWEYRVDEPEEHKNRRLFNNTSFSEGALWKVKETFDAFGVEYGTHTDEMCGEQVRLVVSQRTIQGGNRAGETGNQVDRVLPLKKSKSEKAGKNGARAAADDDDEDDDEEEEKPKKQPAKAGAGAAKGKKKPADDDEDDSEDPF